MLLAFHKPFDVLSQFTQEHPSHRTLAEFGFPPHVYAIGRLDRDSEGSDSAQRRSALERPPPQSPPRPPAHYHAQVDGVISDEALRKLRSGVDLKEFRSRSPAKRSASTSNLPTRRAIRPSASAKTSPQAGSNSPSPKGKNRQVRRMTAAVGFPTLRLVRVSIGGLKGWRIWGSRKANGGN
jgi:23S rRNA pseudouridine2457 synthase